MTKTVKEGEYIRLQWDGTPDEEYVRGHVTPEEFVKAFDGYHKSANQAPTPPVPVRHEYGRWAMAGHGDFGNGLRTLMTYAEPGRGRFKITTAEAEDLTHAGAYERPTKVG